jgi:hypothetical protein
LRTKVSINQEDREAESGGQVIRRRRARHHGAEARRGDLQTSEAQSAFSKQGRLANDKQTIRFIELVISRTEPSRWCRLFS